jgi:hypothetical protein
MQYFKWVSPKQLLVLAVTLCAFFVFLFVNSFCGWFEGDSIVGAIVEFTAIPCVAAIFLVAIYCMAYFIWGKQRNIFVVLALILSVITIVGLFLVP